MWSEEGFTRTVNAYVAGNSGNQAFPEMPGIPVIAWAILRIQFTLTSFEF